MALKTAGYDCRYKRATTKKKFSYDSETTVKRIHLQDKAFLPDRTIFSWAQQW